jgi:hypothetical protein
MELKLTFGQVVFAIIQFIGYAAIFFGLAYRLGKKITSIESRIGNTSDKLDGHIKTVDKVIDKIERAIEKIWDDRLGRK